MANHKWEVTSDEYGIGQTEYWCQIYVGGADVYDDDQPMFDNPHDANSRANHLNNTGVQGVAVDPDHHDRMAAIAEVIADHNHTF